MDASQNESEGQGVAFATQATQVPDSENNSPVSFSSPSSGIGMPSIPLAQKKTQKYAYGLGTITGQSADDIYQNMVAGREQALRDKATSEIAAQDALSRSKQLMSLASKGPIDMDVARSIMLGTQPVPSTVTENAYATKYISTLDDAGTSLGSQTMTDADAQNPQATQAMRSAANTYLSKMEIARNLQDEATDNYENQSWFGWGVDQLKNMIQPYVEYKQRGLNPDVSKFAGVTLGNNLQAQADALFDLPVDQFQNRLTTIYNSLKNDNPTLAKNFVDYVVGKSDNSRAMDDLFSSMLPLDAETGVKLGAGLLKQGSVLLRARQAFKDVLKSSAAAGDNMPISAAAAEGAGDANTAAAIRLQANQAASANGTLPPETPIKQTLTSNFNLDAQKYATNPGSLSREKLTRLMDSADQTGNELNQSLNVLRGNRTPLPLEDPVALKVFNDEVLRPQFRGISNQVVDFSEPIHDPKTNTYSVDVTLGSNDGVAFSSPEVARNNAELNGFKDARIVEVQNEPVEVEPSQLAGPKRYLIRKAQLEGDEGSIARTQRFVKDLQVKLKDKTLTPEARKELLDTFKSSKEILQRYNDQLGEANKKTYMTDARIEQQGVGYKYVVSKPYRETDSVVRNYQIKKGDGSYNPDSLSSISTSGVSSWKNAALGWFRSADADLAVNDTVQRKIATFARANLQKWAKEKAQKIEELASGAYRTDPDTGASVPWYARKAKSWFNNVTLKQKQIFNEFNEVLDYARKAKDPVTGETGYFFQTPGELEDHYQRFYNRLPTFPETEAYFAHVQLTEADRVLREVAEYRNRMREGAEQHQIFFTQDKQKVGSGYFDGVQRFKWPSGEGQVLVMGRNKGDERLAYVSNQKGGFNSAELERYKEGVQTGRYKIIEVYNPSEYPLSEFSDVAGDNYIRYIVTDNSESKPLTFNHVNRRGGGHFEYDYEHYIKQAHVIPQTVSQASNDIRKVVSNLYVGDKTLMPISNRAMGRDIADRMNTVREFIKDGKWDLAEAFARKNLPMEWDEIKGWFAGKTGPNGRKLPAIFDVNEPFTVVGKGKNIYDIDKSLEDRYGKTFVDGTKSGSLAARNKVNYNIERNADNLMTINRSYDNGKPVFNYEPAEMIDPIPTMNRALNRAINSTFMDDYKFYAVEHWLRETTPHLLATDKEVRSSPFYHFYNTQNKSAFKGGTDWATIQNSLLNREKIQQFLGMPNKFDTMIHSLTQHLADAAYEAGGLTERLMVAPIWTLSKLKDPIQLVRSFAFNAKLGLFNPAQMLVQAQTFANILAIEPRRGAAGTYATMLHQMGRINASPEVLKHLDELATKFNFLGSKWKPGEWLEAREALNKTGFEHVAGEHIFSDNQLDNKFVNNQWKNFLNAGQIFFREGEKSTRLGAFYAAFKKFRDENPVGKITDKDLGNILNYADLLTNNMSRASASNLHSGVFSLTSQFLSYQMHLFELFIGKRLGATTAERNLARLRMGVVFSALYGVPAASGLLGYPFGESIRQEALSRGYVVGDNWLKTVAMEGIPSWLTFLATGNAYNFGNRFGNQGLTFVQDAMNSDKTLWKVLGGAGLTSLGSTATSFGPLAMSMISWMNGDNKELGALSASHPFTASDIIEPFKEVSSVNQAWKALYAINTGRWMSKNEGYITDVDKLDAIFMSTLGINPQGQDDMYSKINIMQAEKEAQKYAEKQFTKEYRRGLQASRDNDPTTATNYFKRAFWNLIWSGYPNDLKATVISRATKGYESMMSQVNADFALKHVPEFNRGPLGIDTGLPFLGQNNIPQTRLEQYQTENK